MKRGKKVKRVSKSVKKKDNSKLYIGIAIAIVVLLVFSFLPLFPVKTQSSESSQGKLNSISFWSYLVSTTPASYPTPNPSPTPKPSISPVPGPSTTPSPNPTQSETPTPDEDVIPARPVFFVKPVIRCLSQDGLSYDVYTKCTTTPSTKYPGQYQVTCYYINMPGSFILDGCQYNEGGYGLVCKEPPNSKCYLFPNEFDPGGQSTTTCTKKIDCKTQVCQEAMCINGNCRYFDYMPGDGIINYDGEECYCDYRKNTDGTTHLRCVPYSDILTLTTDYGFGITKDYNVNCLGNDVCVKFGEEHPDLIAPTCVGDYPYSRTLVCENYLCHVVMIPGEESCEIRNWYDGRYYYQNCQTCSLGTCVADPSKENEKCLQPNHGVGFGICTSGKCVAK